MAEAKFIVCKIIANNCVNKQIDLTDNISLYPQGDYRYEFDNGFMMLSCFLYIERIEEKESAPDISLLENLKEFIVFWSITTGDSWPATGLDRGIEIPKVLSSIDDIQTQSSGSYRSDHIIFDLNSPLNFSSTIKEMFQTFVSSDLKSKNKCRFFVSAKLNHGSHNMYYRLNDNYLTNIALDLFVLDSFTSVDWCEIVFNCDKCNGKEVKHHKTSPKERLLKLFADFSTDDADAYSRLIEKMIKKRHDFAHRAKHEQRPKHIMPEKADLDGFKRRSIKDIEEVIEKFGTEGLATMSAELILNEIVRILLLNKIFGTKFSPNIILLKSVGNTLNNHKNNL